MNYLELSYYSCNKHIIFSFIFTILWMFMMLILAALYFRRDLSIAYDICDPITMIYFDKRACYKKMTQNTKSNPLMKADIDALNKSVKDRSGELNQLAGRLKKTDNNIKDMVSSIQEMVTDVKNKTKTTYDMYLANLSNLGRIYDDLRSRIIMYIKSLRPTLANIQSQYSLVHLYNLRNQSNQNTALEQYLKKSYNALADTINENKTFFKQYTSDLDNIPALVTP